MNAVFRRRNGEFVVFRFIIFVKSPSDRTPLFHCFVLLTFWEASIDGAAKPQIMCLGCADTCVLVFLAQPDPLCPRSSRTCPARSAVPQIIQEACRTLMMFFESREPRTKQPYPAISEHKLCHRPRDVSPSISSFVSANDILVANLSYLLSSSISSFLQGISPVHMADGKRVAWVLNSTRPQARDAHTTVSSI
jgi:hypothetical protein